MTPVDVLTSPVMWAVVVGWLIAWATYDHFIEASKAILRWLWRKCGLG